MVSSDHIEPLGEGKIEATISTDRLKGPIIKTVQIRTNDPLAPLTIVKLRAYVVDPYHTGMFPAEELFADPCRRCHVERGIGKAGEELFRADCLMCHRRGKNAQPLAFLRKLTSSRIKRGIESGAPDTMMPGFSSRSGGPLTNSQIRSLVDYIKRK